MSSVSFDMFLGTAQIRAIILCSILFAISILSVEASHIRHQRSNHSLQSHHIHHTSLKPIGEICVSDAECGNSSICLAKMFEDDLELNICQCDHRHMKRVHHSCYVKPGHQCYYPDRDSHGRHLYPCMPGLWCKSGTNASNIHGGYCMCPDLFYHTDDPHRWLDTEYENKRCSGVILRCSQNALFIGVSLVSLWRIVC